MSRRISRPDRRSEDLTGREFSCLLALNRHLFGGRIMHHKSTLFVLFGASFLGCGGAGAWSGSVDAGVYNQSPPPACGAGWSSRWTTIDADGAPNRGEYSFHPHLAFGRLVVVKNDGAGAIFDICSSSWRKVASGGETTALGRSWTIGDKLVFTSHPIEPIKGAILDLERAQYRKFSTSPRELGAHAVQLATSKGIFVWGGGIRRPPPLPRNHIWMDTNEGAWLDVSSGNWHAITTEGAPSPRSKAIGVWTGKTFVVWGGATNSQESGASCDHGGSPSNRECEYFTNGGIYDPATNKWQTMSTKGAPPAMKSSRHLWTGTEMIVWDFPEEDLESTRLYAFNPGANQWRVITDLPFPRKMETGISAGRIVSIGQGQGVVIDPATGRKDPIVWPEDFGACKWIRVAAFEPTRVVVYTPLGCRKGGIAMGGFDPIERRWTTQVLPPLPDQRDDSRSIDGELIWTGKQLIVWRQSFGGKRRSNGCENAPRDVGCDPIVVPPVPTDPGVFIKPDI